MASGDAIEEELLFNFRSQTLWPIFTEEARLRSLANLKDVAKKLGITESLQGGFLGKTSEIVGSFLGISKTTMERLKYEHEEHPEIV